MRATNIMESVVEELLNQHFERLQLTCKCDKCRNDIYALTLNNVPPRYTSDNTGRAYVKADFFEDQAQINIVREIVNASKKISSNPTCGNVNRDVKSTS